MGRVVLSLFAVAIADLYLLAKIAAHVGFFPTLIGVLVSSMVGVRLARLEGLRVLGRWREAMLRHEEPPEGVLGGLLVLVAGLLLFIPGPLTTLLGVALLLSPIRRMVQAVVRSSVERRVREGTMHVGVVRMDDSVYDRGQARHVEVIDTEGETVPSDTAFPRPSPPPQLPRGDE